jgi:hypothetical protein
MDHSARIAATSAAFTEAMTRFLARLEAASPEALTKVPESGGWSPAQLAWHVGATNEAFAGLIDGSLPNARPAPEGYAETDWGAIAVQVPDKLEAPARFHPPAGVSAADAIAKLRASANQITNALNTLTEERAALTVKSTVGPLINLYQVGQWAAAHVARHNSQVKRLLGESG